MAYLYLLTPQGVAEKASLAAAFLGRRLEEYEVLKQEKDFLRMRWVLDIPAVDLGRDEGYCKYFTRV